MYRYHRICYILSQNRQQISLELGDVEMPVCSQILTEYSITGRQTAGRMKKSGSACSFLIQVEICEVRDLFYPLMPLKYGLFTREFN